MTATKLTRSDLVIHQRMLARWQEGQQLQARANQLIAGFQIWAEDLHERYGLDYSRGESVDPDGTINRIGVPDVG